MWKDLREEISLVRILIILSIIAVGSYVFGVVWQFLSSFSDVFVILILAWLLSFILEPVVDSIERTFRLPKVWATLFVYLCIAGILTSLFLLLLPIVITQFQTLSEIIPTQLRGTPNFVHNWVGAITGAIDNSLNYIPSIAQFLFSLFIILILSFYFIVDKEKITRELYDLTPKKWQDELRFFQSVIDSTFASFLRVQVVFGIITGLATWPVVHFLGIEYAASLALISGILGVVPLVGPLLSVIPPVAVAFIVSPEKAVFMLIILTVIQQIIYNVLGPKILGNAFKLHPAIILLSFIVGAKIAGGLGAVLAVPVLGIVVVVFQQLGHRVLSKFNNS